MPRHTDDERDEDRTAIGDLTAVKVANRRDRAHLIVLAGSSLGQMFRVEQNETVIGRGADAAIRIEDDGVSRKHARVVQNGNVGWIEDLESANGTFVNEDRVARHLLRDGDKIQIRHLHAIAARLGLERDLVRALNQRMVVGAIGPTCHAILQTLGIDVHVMPDHPKMGPFIAALLRRLEQQSRNAPGSVAESPIADGRR